MQDSMTVSYFQKRFPCLRSVLEDSCVLSLTDGCFFRTFYFISIMSDFAPKKYLKLEKRACFFFVLFYFIRYLK